MKRQRGPIARYWVPAALGVTMVMALLGLLYAPNPRAASPADPTSDSTSWIGHRAFAELLTANGFEVQRARTDSAARGRPGDLVFILEPDPWRTEDLERSIDVALDEGSTVLVALPKWDGSPDPSNTSHLLEVWLYPMGVLVDLAMKLDRTATLVRKRTFRGDPDAEQIDLESPQLFQGSTWSPELDESTTGDALVLRSPSRSLYVLSDPDLLNNHGLERGDHAAIALALVGRLCKGRCVFVETLHGVTPPPNPWHVLLGWPWILVSLHALTLLALLAWARSNPFGTEPAEVPPIARGRRSLVQNAATLLDQTGRHGHGLSRYLELTLDDIAHRARAPGFANALERNAWLDRTGAHRNVAVRATELVREVTDLANRESRRFRTTNVRPLLAAAARIHRYRKDMLHGSLAGPQRHRSTP